MNDNFYSNLYSPKTNATPIVRPTNQAGAKKGASSDDQTLHIEEVTVGLLDDIKVLNVVGTADEDSHDEIEIPSTCANINCENETEKPEIVRAHVRIKGEPCLPDEAWICNLCHSCNSDDNRKAMPLVIQTKLHPVKMKQLHDTVVEDDENG